MIQTKIISFIFLIPTLVINYITLTYLDHNNNLSVFSTTMIFLLNFINISFCVSILYFGFKKSLIFFLYFFLLLILFDVTFEKFFNKDQTITGDRNLGWILKSNINLKLEDKTSENRKYTINYKTSKVEGFREYGLTDVDRTKKILVIGDSFTNAQFASNESMFYSKIEKIFKERNLYHEWFVGGAGGYGSLQQYILLKKHLKDIDPSMVILQFCSNDFENNSFNLESKTILRSQKLRRPYLINNVITKDNSFVAKIYRILSNYSYVFNVSDMIISNMEYRKYGGYFKENVTKLDIQESIQVTKEILYKFKNLLKPDTKVYSINCSIDNKEKKIAWLDITKNLGIIALPQPNEKLKIAEINGLDIWQRDRGHLNNLGNQIYGEAIAVEILKDLNKN